MKTKVFIDGQEGTTGLQIFERFANRSDIELIDIPPEKRKDPAARAVCIHASDVTFLCLPDAAAIEAVSLVQSDTVRIIDASTAHRTAPGWAYGFPELSDAHRNAIISSKRVAVPGCYASGFAAIVYPLVQANILPRDYPVSCFAVSGYSGGGKKMIAQYEEENRDSCFDAPRMYAMTQQHKHLREMKAISGLLTEPIFSPMVSDYYNGMLVTIPIHRRCLSRTINLKSLHEMLSAHYENAHFVKVMPLSAEAETGGFLAANPLAGTNEMRLYVCGNDDRMTVTAQFDNLGKGASGAAVQCLNLMLGIDEATGLE